MSDEVTTRPGSGADLSRRMDVMETNHQALAKEVTALHSAVTQIQGSIATLEKVNDFQFKSLDASIASLRATFEPFMKRIEGMLTGEVETVQSREGRALVADYQSWRRWVDRRINMLMGGLALVAFVCGLVVPTILGWFKP